MTSSNDTSLPALVELACVVSTATTRNSVFVTDRAFQRAREWNAPGDSADGNAAEQVIPGAPPWMNFQSKLVIDGDPEATIAAAAGRLNPGDVVLVDLDERSLSAAKTARSARDVLGTMLYRYGFGQTRFRFVNGRFLAAAVKDSKQPPTQRDCDLSVILPAFNEVATIGTVLDKLLAKEVLGVAITVFVVESNSTDGTRDLVLSYQDHPRVEVVLEESPKGKGHAVRTGLAAANGDLVLIQDADLEYDLDDYERLLWPLRNFEASFVLGKRAKTKGARFGGVRHFERELLTSYAMNLGNHFFLWLFNTVYGTKLEDPFTMYKVFRRDCLEGVPLEANRFDFDWEIVGKLCRLGYNPVEIEVSYHSRPFAEGKKIKLIRDPLTWIRACFKYRFSALEA